MNKVELDIAKEEKILLCINNVNKFNSSSIIKKIDEEVKLANENNKSYPINDDLNQKGEIKTEKANVVVFMVEKFSDESTDSTPRDESKVHNNDNDNNNNNHKSSIVHNSDEKILEESIEMFNLNPFTNNFENLDQNVVLERQKTLEVSELQKDNHDNQNIDELIQGKKYNVEMDEDELDNELKNLEAEILNYKDKKSEENVFEQST